MRLEELHEKIIKEVEKRIGTMDEILNLEDDVLLCYPESDYFGHFKSYPDFILAILYYNDDGYPWYNLQTTLKDSGDIEYGIDIVDDISKKDYSNADFDVAMDRINAILDEIGI